MAEHRIPVKMGEFVDDVRDRIETTLGVATRMKPEGDIWAIYFYAPLDTNLDFLRPDVLPANPKGYVMGVG